MKVKVIHMTIDHVKDEDILEEGDIIKIEVEGHQIEKVVKMEGIKEEEDPLIDDEDPLIMEDPLMMEDPLIMEDPLMMEDPQEMEDC